MNDPASLNAMLAARDLAHVWHPCTQMREHDGTLPLIPIVRGDGAWLVDAEGNRYLDGISSWWSNLFGHANPRIAAAIAGQAARLNHVMLAGFTHEPALQLAEELVRVAPPGLERVSYASDGASAVEIALKMSFHYWHNAGFPERRRFIALANAYHGETLGALSVSDLPLYRAVYGPLLFDPIVAPSPDWLDAEPGESPDDVAKRRLGDLRALLERHARETCAVIVEPLVQCSGGMRMHSPVYLAGLRRLCDEFDVHLIADEIAVGFGRTGTLFACEQAAIRPDFICLSKGITGGYLPLSAVLTTDAVYAAFYGDATARGFLHSHSYTGNPLACRAALAVLDIFESDRVVDANRLKAQEFTRALAGVAAHPRAGHFRQAGMIWAFDVTAARPGFSSRFHRAALEQGVFIRPIGNTVYVMPPYVTSADAMRALAATLLACLERPDI